MRGLACGVIIMRLPSGSVITVFKFNPPSFCFGEVSCSLPLPVSIPFAMDFKPFVLCFAFVGLVGKVRFELTLSAF